jgi:glutamyl-tRNA synthetase
MEISHVIRGEDHLMNTPKHLQLIEAFGGKAPQYAHIPLILNADGSKMSKRDAGAAVGDYPRQGFLPAAVVNFVALLGWSSKTDEEIFTMDQLVDRFSLENVNRAPGRFDFEKCKWVNQQHLADMSVEEFAAAAKHFVEKAGLPIPENYHAVIAAVKNKVRLISEVPAAVDFLIKDDFETDKEAVATALAQPLLLDVLFSLIGVFRGIPEWSANAATSALNEAAQAARVKPGQLMFPLRVALSGRRHGPDLKDILDLLGQDRCVDRLRKFSLRLL